MRRPAPAERPSRHAVDDEPVLAQRAAVGLDRGVADLGRQQRADGGLAAQALVGPPVDAHRVAVGQPDLVGHAARRVRAARSSGSPASSRACRARRQRERVAHPVLALLVISPGSTASVACRLTDMIRTAQPRGAGRGRHDASQTMRGRLALAEQLDRVVLVDVADEPVVDAVADELAQARARSVRGDRRAGCRAAGSPAGGCSRRSSSWRCRCGARRCVLAPPPCQRLPCQTSTLPLGISAGMVSYVPAEVGRAVGAGGCRA